MELKSLIFILLILLIKAQFPFEDTCQKIECSESLDNDTCIQVMSKTSFFKECPSGKICDIKIDDPIFNSKCIENTRKFKRLPTLPCESDDDCISGICNGKECMGKFEREKCNSSTDCVYGLTCRKDSEKTYRCLEPITTGNKCEVDTDCVNESGCLNNICTKYFSIENNQMARYLPQDELSFCKSGYSNEIGICQNITLINDNMECSKMKKCEYNISNGERIVINNNCLCGYNIEGKKYCRLGSGNKNYTKYMHKLKKYYIDNQNCHLSERKSEGCQKDLLSNDTYILKAIKELINSKYWAISSNKLIGAPECAYKVELIDYDRDLDKEYNPDPIPGEGSCAKYQCDNSNSKKEFCAQSNYKNIFNINVTLNDICLDGVSCQIGGDPNIIFYNKTNVNSQCFSQNENKRYPGEKCEVDTECFYPINNPSSQFHKCEDGRCNGIDDGGICEDNTWCLAGYYCDKYSGKCREQKSKNENCLDTKECRNNLICLNRKCSENLFSLENGEKVPEIDDEEFQKKFCKSGEVYENICVGFNEVKEMNDNNNTNSNDYTKCNFGEKCLYDFIGLNYRRRLELSCSCGYNSEGQGYCPKFYDDNNKDWKTYRDVLKNNYDNECHTENRYNCYKTSSMDKEKQLKNKLEKGHLFYNSVPCAEKVLKGNNIYFNKIFILLGTILVLF